MTSIFHNELFSVHVGVIIFKKSLKFQIKHFYKHFLKIFFPVTLIHLESALNSKLSQTWPGTSGLLCSPTKRRSNSRLFSQIVVFLTTMQYYKAVSGFALASFPGSLPSFFLHVVFTIYVRKKAGQSLGTRLVCLRLLCSGNMYTTLRASLPMSYI